MSLKRFSGWFILAGVLLAFILLVQPRLRKHSQTSVRLLPGFQAASVTSIEVRPQGKPEIRAEHTNSHWMLTEPLTYPARTVAIDALLAVLAGAYASRAYNASGTHDEYQCRTRFRLR